MARTKQLPSEEDWEQYYERYRRGEKQQAQDLAAQRRGTENQRMSNQRKTRRKSVGSRARDRVHAKAVLAICRRAGCPELSESLIASRAPVAQIKVQLERAKAIKRHCADADLLEIASGYIGSTMTVAEVRAQLALATSIIESRGVGSPTREPIAAADIYRERNARHMESVGQTR